MVGTETLTLQDGAVALWWLAANALLLWLSLKWAQRLLPSDPGSLQLMHTLVIYLAAVIGLVILIGALGLLSGPTVLLAASGLIAAGWWGLRRLGPAAEGVRREKPPEKSASLSMPNRWSWLWSCAGAFLIAHMTLHGLLRFPSDFDSLMYHIPLINHWLQAGNLYVPESANWFLAANNEILGAWMVAPFSGDFLIGMNNLPIVILWAAASFQLCLLLGLRGAWAHLIAFATLLVHSLWHQTDDAGNDLAVVAYFLAGACYSLRYLRAQRRTDLVLCGVCIGLLAGVKYFALGYAAVLAGTLLCCSWTDHGLRHSLRATALAVAASLPVGGYWYIRNAIAGGSPLYPMGASGAESGLGYPSLWQTTFAGNGNPRLLELGLDAAWRMTGPWHYLAVLLTPAILLYLIAVPLSQAFLARPPSDRRSMGSSTRSHGQNAAAAEPTRSDPQGRALTHLVLYLWLVGSAAILMITPFALEDQPGTLNHLRWAYTPVRYGLCYLSIASISLGLILHDTAAWMHAGRWHSYLNRPLLAVVGVTVLWQLQQRLSADSHHFFQTEAILLAVNLGLLGIGVSLVYHRVSWGSRVVTGGLLTISLVVGVAWLSQRWHAGLGEHFDRYFGSTVFSKLVTQPHRERVLVLDPRPYPFFGSRRQHHVINPRFPQPADEFARFAEANRITLVSTRRDHGNAVNRYRGSLEALENGAPYFEKTEAPGRWCIFRVRDDAGPAEKTSEERQLALRRTAQPGSEATHRQDSPPEAAENADPNE